MAASQQIGLEMSYKKRDIKRGGFTLMELLVVMAIISILMGMIVGVGIYANQAVMRARARAELQDLHTALQKYRIDTGVYPGKTEFNKVRTNLSISMQNRFDRRDKSALIDPWKRPFIYSFDPQNPETYALYSEGLKQNNPADDIYSGK